MDAEKLLRQSGMAVPEIYLPAEGTDMQKWAVIACDQHSSEPEYWEKTGEFVRNAPSSLNLIFPECYLEDPQGDSRIRSIQESMDSYLKKGILTSRGKGFVLLKRTTPNSAPRWGLVTSLDLDEYDYSPQSTSLIRATEGTILDRIPPRRKIREGAPLELPHIMVLLDDPGRLTIEPLCDEIPRFPLLYDFELMFGAGRVTGYFISEQDDLFKVGSALKTLKENGNSAAPLLYAMGDGNHSLATAKAIWEDLKKKLPPDSPERENHPARFALVELVNLFDEGIEFQPIHRVLFKTDPEEAVKALASDLGAEWIPGGTPEETARAVSGAGSEPRAGILSSRLNGILVFKGGRDCFPTGLIQDWLDQFLPGHPGSRLDYIHGWESTARLAGAPGNLGILLPAIRKDSFFETIRTRGVFPRKTFSMGESWEKRFYIESRVIRK